MCVSVLCIALYSTEPTGELLPTSKDIIGYKILELYLSKCSLENDK